MSALKGGNIGKGVVQEFSIKEGRGRPSRKTIIESLPDDVLLLIFSFYLDQAQDEERWSGEREEEWHALVHVCRRWRCVVFASPRHLRLRLVCTERRLVKEMNDIWPEFPIIIRMSKRNNPLHWTEWSIENIIAALEHNDRVSEICFYHVPNRIVKIFAAVMKEPFPLLTSLSISSSQAAVLVLPDFFLGGSAPRLRYLHLDLEGVGFSALQTLLSSTSVLDNLSLQLDSIYSSISSDEMVSCLSAATRLRSLDLGGFIQYDGEGCRPAPSTRIVFPDLTHFSWKGTRSYLNELLACIDAPQLYSINMTFYDDMRFMVMAPQVAQFISRTEGFKEPYRANIIILRRSTELIFPLRTQTIHYPSLKLVVNYPYSWPISYLVRTCRSSFPPLSAVERLDIEGEGMYSGTQRETENTDWLEFLDLFVAVKDLRVSKKFTLHIAQTLQVLSVERATEVLPALHNLFMEGLEPSGPLQEAVEQFVATRQLAGHPVAVRPWTAPKVREENFIAIDPSELI